MNWHDWENVWQRQELPVGANADLAILKQTFETKHRRMRRTLLVRDCSEVAAAVFVAGIFGWIGLKMGPAGWPFLIAVVLLLAVAAVFVRERVRIRRARLGPDAPLADKIGADLNELRWQKRLLSTVAGWYIAPIFAAELIVVVPIFQQAHVWQLRLGWIAFVGVVVFLGLVNLAVIVLNRYAVRRQIEPRIAELERLQRDLTS